MKRRNFLASLLALPFVAKPLAALASHYDLSAFSIEQDIDDPYVRLFDRNGRQVSQNTEALRQLVEAMRLNAPRGFKIDPYIYGMTDPKEVARLVRRYQNRREKK